jgi:hypothetical protein
MIVRPNQTTVVMQSLRVVGKHIPVVAVDGELEHPIIIDFFIRDHGVDSRAADRERASFLIGECGGAKRFPDAERYLTGTKLEETAPNRVSFFDNGAAVECVGDVERAFGVVVIDRREY